MSRKELLSNIDKVVSYPFISGLCDRCKYVFKDKFGTVDCEVENPIAPCANIKLCCKFEEETKDEQTNY